MGMGNIESGERGARGFPACVACMDRLGPCVRLVCLSSLGRLGSEMCQAFAALPKGQGTRLGYLFLGQERGYARTLEDHPLSPLTLFNSNIMSSEFWTQANLLVAIHVPGCQKCLVLFF